MYEGQNQYLHMSNITKNKRSWIFDRYDGLNIEFRVDFCVKIEANYVVLLLLSVWSTNGLEKID